MLLGHPLLGDNLTRNRHFFGQLALAEKRGRKWLSDHACVYPQFTYPWKRKTGKIKRILYKYIHIMWICVKKIGKNKKTHQLLFFYYSYFPASPCHSLSNRTAEWFALLGIALLLIFSSICVYVHICQPSGCFFFLQLCKVYVCTYFVQCSDVFPFFRQL